MKSAGKARSNGLYRHIRTSKEIIRNLLNDSFQKSNNKFNAYIANNTNGTSQSILISISASEFFDQTTAEFINEHPSWGATDNGLTNYGTTKWTNCKVYTMSNSWVNLGSTTYDRAIMVGKNNRTMAQPSGLSGTSFTSTWYNYN